MPRNTLARFLSGHVVDLQAQQASTAMLLEAARDEGVVTLVSQRLASMPGAAPELRTAFANEARQLTMAALLFEVEARRVLKTLAAADIPVLLLKGSALAYWLYPAPYLRECADIDLLFRSRAEAEQAAVLMQVHGYVPGHPPGDLAYEMSCELRRGGANRLILDLHWRVANAPLFADTLDFDGLQARSIALPLLGANARGLAPPDAFANACLHRSLNLFRTPGDRLKWLYDIHLLCASLQPPAWDTFVALCRERGLCGVCHDGIATTVAAFGTPLPAALLDALAVGRGGEWFDAVRLRRWSYLQYCNLAALPDAMTRLRWVWQRIFLPLPTLRAIHGEDHAVPFLLWHHLRGAWRRLLE